jgi:hypothetical protein
MCMHCRAPWDDEHLETLGKPFLAQLKAYRLGVYTSEERRNLVRYYRHSYRIAKENENEASIDMVRVQIEQTTSQLMRLRGDLERLASETHQYDGPVVLCDRTECDGVIGESMRCSMCRRQMCERCLTEHPPEQNCESSIVRTRSVVLRTTKPCPNCRCEIVKLGGCDQMWCTLCKCTFSWKTGAILNATVIHNPHFILSNSNQPDTTNWTVFVKDCEQDGIELNSLFHSYFKILQSLPFILQAKLDKIAHKLETIGVQYLLNQLTKQTWTRRVYLHKSNEQRLRVVTEEIDRFVRNGYELLDTMCLSFRNDHHLAHLKETIGLFNTRMDSLARSSNKYKPHLVYINQSFEIVC